MLIMAHMDVVEARRADWSRDPFQLGETDGYFYGRGTLDDNPALIDFASALEAVVIETVESGKMTKDLASLVGPDQAWQTTEEFLASLDENLQAKLA